MKQKPLLISLLISLGTGVIAGFLTFKSKKACNHSGSQRN